MAVPADGWLNLIHVDDAASVVVAAETRAPLPGLYVVSDGHPVERRVYYEELARLSARSTPSFRAAGSRTPATGRGNSDKRIVNRRMLAELDVGLAYPSYREGLAAIVAGDQGDR